MDEQNRIMELAYEAGAILLENGAEISRVDETMRRIAGHYGVDDENFFVLSNGIMATAKGFARTKFIPIKGASLDKVVAVNQLSREVSVGKCDLEQLESRLKSIRAMRPKPAWEQIAASAFGSAAFCIIFGGGFADSIAAFVAGLVLWVYMLFVGYRHLSRIAGTITGGLLATVLCGVMYKLGLGTHLSNMIIGAIIPLIPGVPFTNGIRDLAHEDYIAGVTRLLDALLTFFCISMGVALAFMLDAAVSGTMQHLETLTAAPETAGMFVQLLAAYVGTVAFAVLFGVPRKYYLDSGLCGMLGWLLYLILVNHTGLSVANVVFFATVLVVGHLHGHGVGHRAQVSDHGLSDLRHLPVGAGRGHLLDHLQRCLRATWCRLAHRRHRPEGHRRHRLRHHLSGGAEREEPDWEVALAGAMKR